MANGVCVNIDKQEYMNFGDLPSGSYKDSQTSNTIGYLLGTEWAGDRLVFAFEGMEKGLMCPDENDDLYSYAIENYDERCTLESVPKFRYVLNQTKNTYYDKLSIPEGDDGTYFDPVSLLLSASNNQSCIGMSITEDERKEIGLWCGDKLRAVNNIMAFPGFSYMVPSFRKESVLKDKLKDLNIAITGTLSNCSRYDAQMIIAEAGGTFHSSVKKSTNYLVVAANPGKSKIDKANDYGIPRISEEEFFDMLK